MRRLHPDNVSSQAAIDHMLLSEWEAKKYRQLYDKNIAPVVADGVPYRLIESNDYLGGVTNASNAFASALWALDYMHWWAAHGCAGVNFHNKSWLLSDTIYLDSSGSYRANPKSAGVTLGGAMIMNNAPWLGEWTNLGPMTNGQCVLRLPATSAVIVRLRQ